MSGYFAIFSLFFYLGLISFGGPTAHIALFQQELIEKRKWLTPTQYTQLVAICQFLPGPSSSQIGMALGFVKEGYFGALLAWLGFTLPSAIMLCAIAIGAMQFDLMSITELLQALKIAACAIVAYAVFSMIKQICTQSSHYILMLLMALGCWYFSTAIGQWLWIILGGVIGIGVFKNSDVRFDILEFKVSKTVGYICIALFFSLFLILAMCSHYNIYFRLADIFYQSGGLVFGGGHVVLPLLQQEIIGQELLEEQLFLAGYGMVQAMPGPLFNFASYLGAVLLPTQPILGAMLATMMIFVPAVLVLFGILPFIKKLDQARWLNSALVGINVTVVGILLATFFDPVLIGSIKQIVDVVIVLILFSLLFLKKLPVWGVVILSCSFYIVFL